VSYEHRHYNGDEPFFLETRVDKQYDSRIGVNYSLGSGWLLVAQVAHTNNQSNIDLDAYNRTVSSISVRWTF
jgi:hypothetical protein